MATTTANGAANGAAKGSKKKNGGGTVAALVQTAPATIVVEGKKQTVKDLDKAIAEVRRLGGERAASHFELGRKILEINESKLWKLRMGEDGKTPLYKSFEAFVHHELSMSPSHAYNAIECAKNYASADEIRQLGGTSNAVLILKAAPADRPRLVEKAKSGATKREMAKEVAESRKKNGPAKQSQQAKAGARAQEVTKAAKAKVAEKITVANITGTRTIKLYKKPESLKGLKWPPEKRAGKLGDTPFGRLELQPGVVQYFSVLQKEGELVLNIQTVREDG